MSKIQTALHAMPTGSIVTQELMTSTRKFNNQLYAVVQGEITTAKQVQQETGCAWPMAIQAIVYQGQSTN